jgi:GAF domain-containing protein
MTNDRLVESLLELADVLNVEQGLMRALAVIAHAATRSVPGADAASIAISIAGRPATATVSAPIALEIDLVQYDTGEGPCLESFKLGKTVRLDVFEPDQPFPHFAPMAQAAGIRAVLSVPAMHDDEVVGTLNVYSRGDGFDESSETVASILGAEIAMAIVRSPEYPAARVVADEAQQASDEHTAVGLAEGVLMGTYDVGVDQARRLIENAAETDATTLVEIAHRIIRQATEA